MDFIRHPARYWAENTRQLDKSIRRMGALREYYSWSESDLCFFILRAATWRLENGQDTTYLPNFGSSGSHLVQKVLAGCVPSHPLGEVYIAKYLIPEIEMLNPFEQCIAMEAYNILHSNSPSRLFSPSMVINTAHNASLRGYSEWTRRFRPVFLMRNPAELAISRTFRKAEYRSFLGEDHDDDWIYLEKNISQTKAFYERAINRRYSLSLKFEDVLANSNDAVQVVHRLVAKYGISVDEVAHNLRAVQVAGTGTNRYDGERRAIDESYVDYAKSQMSSLCERLNYF